MQPRGDPISRTQCLIEVHENGSRNIRISGTKICCRQGRRLPSRVLPGSSCLSCHQQACLSLLGTYAFSAAGPAGQAWPRSRLSRSSGCRCRRHLPEPPFPHPPPSHTHNQEAKPNVANQKNVVQGSTTERFPGRTGTKPRAARALRKGTKTGTWVLVPLTYLPCTTKRHLLVPVQVGVGSCFYAPKLADVYL